ncbi:MAG: hypothetical protein NVSMB47_16470 [Polyangiales bacterium]
MTVRDVVIVGSGFGGAVIAARLGAAVRAASGSAGSGDGRVLVLERGDDLTGDFDPRSDGDAPNAQGNRFRQSLSPEYTAKVTELHTDPVGAWRAGVSSMNVVAGRGLGGGSNVYDGVSLRAPTESFEQTRDGARLWPRSYTRAALDPWYAIVEARLSGHRLAWTDRDAPHGQRATTRDLVFAEGCRRIGATATPLKVADDRDANEGWWNQGQRFQGRQGLAKNYLLDAKGAGVELWTGCDVDTIAPASSGGGWVVTGTDRRGGVHRRFEIECKVLVVAAGAVASSALLLRSRDGFVGDRSLDRSGALGKRLSANGDYGVTGVVGKDFELAVEGHKGKPMSSFSPSFWPRHRFILIPFYAAPLYLALGQPSTLLHADDPRAVGRGSTQIARGADGRVERDWGLAYKQRLKTFGPRMLTMGCLALDDGEGEIEVRDDATTRLAWRTTSATTEARWTAALVAMRGIYEALGGELYLDAYRAQGTVNTAHPLGGCRMGDPGGPNAGVVDALGEVHGNPNLFVVDGAVIPTALGVNPSLTIAAVAESIADRLIRGDGTASLAERLR